jgi:chaperone modulatory protein CbpM
VGYALVLVRPARLNLEAFARATGTHPDLIRRLVVLGILEAGQDAAGELWFPPGQVAAMGRVQRLRAGFGLNYAAVGLVTDLLDRIAVLEAALREAQRPGACAACQT